MRNRIKILKQNETLLRVSVNTFIIKIKTLARVRVNQYDFDKSVAGNSLAVKCARPRNGVELFYAGPKQPKMPRRSPTPPLRTITETPREDNLNRFDNEMISGATRFVGRATANGCSAFRPADDYTDATGTEKQSINFVFADHCSDNRQ
jgi:hypothetical protein